jgi:hypothetical protein
MRTQFFALARLLIFPLFPFYYTLGDVGNAFNISSFGCSIIQCARKTRARGGSRSRTTVTQSISLHLTWEIEGKNDSLPLKNLWGLMQALMPSTVMGHTLSSKARLINDLLIDH